MSDATFRYPRGLLVVHDIQLNKVRAADGREQVQATVDCERKQCAMTVDACRECPRFARIEVHEAGYVMLCRSAEASLDDPPARDAAPDS